MRTIIYTTFAVIFFSGIFFSGIALADSLPETDGIGIVDIQRVIDETRQGKAARQKVEKAVEKSRVKLDKMKKEFEDEREQTKKQIALLSEDAREQTLSQLRGKERDLTRRVRDHQEEILRMEGTEIKKVIDQINEVVNTLASDKGIDFVLEKEKRVVLYSSDKLDFTDQVIEKMNKRR